MGDGWFEDSEVIAELARDTRAEKGTEDKMGEVSRVLFTAARARSKRDQGCAVSSVSVRLLGALGLGCEFVHLTDCETTG